MTDSKTIVNTAYAKSFGAEDAATAAVFFPEQFANAIQRRAYAIAYHARRQCLASAAYLGLPG